MMKIDVLIFLFIVCSLCLKLLNRALSVNIRRLLGTVKNLKRGVNFPVTSAFESDRMLQEGKLGGVNVFVTNFAGRGVLTIEFRILLQE